MTIKYYGCTHVSLTDSSIVSTDKTIAIILDQASLEGEGRAIRLVSIAGDISFANI